jgi:sugar O-acyltransferase (sialic acid O-acetyltransferase NeuD family)
MSMTSRIILVGGGAFAREVLCWIDQARITQALPSKVGYLDREAGSIDPEKYSAEYFGDIEDFQPLPQDRLVMAIGDPKGKERTAAILRSKGGQFMTLIHPSAVLAPTAKIGQGCVICPHALVSADAQMEELVTVNTLSSVGHDVIVGSYTTLSSHVDLMGGAIISEMVFFGSGSRVLPKVKVGLGAKIGVGAIVGRTVKAETTMYTALARRL